MPLRLAFPKLLEKHRPIPPHDSARNPPLRAVHEQQWTYDLNQHQSEEEVRHTRTRPWHDAPSGGQLARLLASFVPPARRVLHHPKRDPDDKTGDQSSDCLNHVYHGILNSFVWQAARGDKPSRSQLLSLLLDDAKDQTFATGVSESLSIWKPL
jgi:hypothetical protein